ncbi:MAG: hypothetical protein ACW981_13475 [Candidatus Hodarchaeales archaeon]|jgi:hypothetical protein
MFVCDTCNRTFPISIEKNLSNKPFIHIDDDFHVFQSNDRKIHLESLIRLINDEEISAEDSGELEAEENPFKAPCFLCGFNEHTDQAPPCICPPCNVLLCDACFWDHDDLL